ncbi:adenosylmethionine--8-amino-7-oxononanoate transaminase, partial [Francisella tularensis subsp. holarctica]|nr:adenosylmethionine--8-amino-7-oxononanoate transaminase [Francisella tularensis subsp. holarctica]
QLTKAFLHSHTHSVNVLGAVVANAVLDIFDVEHILTNVKVLEKQFSVSFLVVREQVPLLPNVRGSGAVSAAAVDVGNCRAGVA